MPGSKSCQRGYGLEKEAKGYLEQKDCLVLYANGFSGIDFIAFDSAKYKTVYFIKCKRGVAKIDKLELVKLTRIADKYNAVPVYCSKRPGRSISFINMNTTIELDFKNDTTS